MRSAGDVTRARDRPGARRRDLAVARSASSCSRGATTVAGGCGSCWSTSVRYYVPYSTPERPRPVDADELLTTVGLTELADRRISTLSGGQRRRLDVAIGIVGRPELLFLDEPTVGLRPAGAARVPRRRAPAGRLRVDDDHAHHARPRRGREAGRPHPDPRRRPDRRRRQRRRAVPAGGRPDRGEVEPATASASCTPPRTPRRSSASCSPSTASGSRTWRCAGRPWRTPTWRWSSGTRPTAGRHRRRDAGARGAPSEVRHEPRCGSACAAGGSSWSRASPPARTRSGSCMINGIFVLVLFFQRDATIPGTDISLAAGHAAQPDRHEHPRRRLDGHRDAALGRARGRHAAARQVDARTAWSATWSRGSRWPR